MRWVNNDEFQKFSIYQENLNRGYKLKDKEKFYNIT